MLFTMTTKRINKCCLLLITFINTLAFAQVGERCTMRTTGVPGTCKFSSECPIVQQQASNGITPTICGFYQLTVPIVCCETNSFIEPNDNSFINNRPDDSFVYPTDQDNEPPPPVQKLTKSEQKCQEYSKSTVGVVQAIPLVTDTEAISITTVRCEYNGVGLIVGGQAAESGEFPFMAAIGFYEDNQLEWRCGGTLISDQYILTAAHCTFTRGGDAPQVVRLGDTDLTRSDDGSVHADYNIKQIIVHPRYRYPNKYNDIALLQLNRKVKFSKYIRPACLYNKQQIDQAQAIATGWGKTDYAAAGTSDRLMKVSLDIYSNDRCAKVYLPNKNLPQGIKSNMLCVGQLKGGMDTCQGDSGGPLLITKKGNQCKFYIIGVTSFGKSCGQANTPAIYTKVAEYVPWIEKTIW